MAQMTVTEALAEIKLIGKRIEKKRQFVTDYMARQRIVVDPLEREGGSVEAIKAERQAIKDLESRIVEIRRAIRVANEAARISVDGEERSLADWLAWRRDVSGGRKAFLASMRSKIAEVRKQALQRGGVVSEDADSLLNTQDIIVNVRERELAEEAERVETILGTLDGLLSLKNATTMVTLD